MNANFAAILALSLALAACSQVSDRRKLNSGNLMQASVFASGGAGSGKVLPQDSLAGSSSSQGGEVLLGGSSNSSSSSSLSEPSSSSSTSSKLVSSQSTSSSRDPDSSSSSSESSYGSKPSEPSGSPPVTLNGETELVCSQQLSSEVMSNPSGFTLYSAASNPLLRILDINSQVVGAVHLPKGTPPATFEITYQSNMGVIDLCDDPENQNSCTGKPIPSYKRLSNSNSTLILSILSVVAQTGGEIRAAINSGACVMQRSPLVFNFNRAGAAAQFKLSGPTARPAVSFDLLGNGQPVVTGWLADPNLAFLTKRGPVSSGRDLFGDSTVLKDGQLAQDGFYALQDFAGGATVIKKGDAVYDQLQLWFAYGYTGGRPDPSQYRTLAEMGVEQIDIASHELCYQKDQNGQFLLNCQETDANHNFTTARSVFTFNGQTGLYIDVFFSYLSLLP